MHTTTSSERPTPTSVNAGPAGSRAVLGSYRRLPAGAADVAQVAPFAAGWPHHSFLELGALPSAVPCGVSTGLIGSQQASSVSSGMIVMPWPRG
jgi:hypothetical protein